MPSLGDFLPTFGKPVLDLSGGGGAIAPSADKYPPMDKSILLVLADQNKISAKAMAVLLKEYTFDDAVSLYQDDEITDEKTFVIVTGKNPPTAKDMVEYGAWKDIPALSGLAAGPMAFDLTVLSQSETWTFSNDLRVSFFAEWRPKLNSDAEGYPSAHGEHELYITIPPDGIIVGAVSDKRRTWSAIGRLIRRWSGATTGYAAGELEYRYVAHLARRTGG